MVNNPDRAQARGVKYGRHSSDHWSLQNADQLGEEVEITASGLPKAIWASGTAYTGLGASV